MRDDRVTAGRIRPFGGVVCPTRTAARGSRAVAAVGRGRGGAGRRAAPRADAALVGAHELDVDEERLVDHVALALEHEV